MVKLYKPWGLAGVPACLTCVLGTSGGGDPAVPSYSKFATSWDVRVHGMLKGVTLAGHLES